MFDRKDFAGEQHKPERGIIVLIQFSELCQEAQDRWSRVPHGNLLLSNPRCQPSRVLTQLLLNQHECSTVFKRDINVKNRQIEMKWSMGRKPIIFVGLKYLGAPVDKAGGIAVRQHDTFRPAG